MADGVVAGQRSEALLVEHRGGQAGVLVQPGPATVAHGDARRLLTAVLQRVEAEESHAGNSVTVGCGQAEYAAHGQDTPDPRLACA